MTNKRCLVFETLGKVSDLEIVESKSKDGLMRLSGVFGVCGVRNNNNRIYDKENYRQMVESLQKVIKESGCPGELEHPNSMNINLENVSHKIEDIQMNEDGTITGTIVLLNTPKGQIAQAIVEGGLPLFISSRAAGTMTNESGVSHVTLSTIKTYDLVGTPGFSQAKLTLKENQTLECLNESAEEENQVWAIVEGDDLLGDDSDDNKKDDKKEDKKDDKKDDKKEDKKEEDNKEEKPADNANKATNKEDNKNTKDTNIDMKDLKEAIDKLADKVTSLEAELHVAQESLNESKSSTVNYDAIQQWVVEEFGKQFKAEMVEYIDENTSHDDSLDDKIQEAIENIATGVQNWVTEEFAPEVQNWVTEEFAPEVQSWVTEEFAPEVQNWVTEEFAPEVQNWITEEFAPEVQNWITEEYSPMVQNWITEEFAPVVDSWITEEFAAEQIKSVNESVSAFLEDNKAGRLEEIDSLLETISSNDTPLENIVKENNTNSKFKGVFVVEYMPSEYKPLWEMLDESRQDAIIRASRMYDFTKEGVLESFWANQDLTVKKEPVVESVNPQNAYHQSIFQQMMRLRNL